MNLGVFLSIVFTVSVVFVEPADAYEKLYHEKHHLFLIGEEYYWENNGVKIVSDLDGQVEVDGIPMKIFGEFSKDYSEELKTQMMDSCFEVEADKYQYKLSPDCAENIMLYFELLQEYGEFDSKKDIVVVPEDGSIFCQNEYDCIRIVVQ